MTNISIKSSDGFELGCYCATPGGSAKGAVVVIQEIFGVNSHIRDVADRYAHNGYNAYAPMLFDRVGRGIELGYEEADMGKGIDLAFNQLDLAVVLEDVQATVNQAASDGRVGLVGFCFGGFYLQLLVTTAVALLVNLIKNPSAPRCFTLASLMRTYL